MDWNLRPSWDLTELEQETSPNIDAVNGSSSFGNHRTKGGFSIDLKLGQGAYSGDELMDRVKEQGVSKMASLPSGSSKRARGAGNGSQTASCLVDGCIADLSNCREYHRRHKVCEIHSKTPQVTICGQKQRFCQQCSRFHSLEEFDEGKRSCRKRLDGHNRRRRKSQPEPMSHTGSILSNYQGGQLLPFSSSQIYPSTFMVNPTWDGVINPEDRLYSQQQQLHLPDKQNLFLGSSTSSYNYKGEKQFTFLQGDNMLNKQTSPEASIWQPLLKPVALSESDGAGRKIFCDGLTAQIHDSECAFSLLSSPQTQISGSRLRHMDLVKPNSIPSVQPLGPILHCNSLEPMDSVLVSTISNVDDRCQGMLHTGSDGSSGNEAPQSLPFHWE